MKAARFYGGEDIRLETLPDPVPEAGEVLVQVEATGICGSDLHGYHANPPKPLSPRTAGHELTGEVVALGAGDVKHKVGARVAVEPTIPCNECSECLSGNYNICSKLVHIGGMAYGGGFAEYMVAPEDNVYTLPDNVSFEAGALAEVYAVACPCGCQWFQCSPVIRLPVIGSGPIGLTIAQMADLAGAESVAILGKPDGPLQIAQQMIGAITINVETTDPVEEVKAWTNGRGAPIVFEAVVAGQTH